MRKLMAAILMAAICSGCVTTGTMNKKLTQLDAAWAARENQLTAACNDSLARLQQADLTNMRNSQISSDQALQMAAQTKILGYLAQKCLCKHKAVLTDMSLRPTDRIKKYLEIGCLCAHKDVLK